MELERRSGVYQHGMRLAAYDKWKGTWFDLNLTLGYRFDNAHTSLKDVTPWLVKNAAQVHSLGGEYVHRPGDLGLTLLRKNVTWGPPKLGRIRTFMYRKPRVLKAGGFVLSKEGELVAYCDFKADFSAREGVFAVNFAEPAVWVSQDILFYMRGA